MILFYQPGRDAQWSARLVARNQPEIGDRAAPKANDYSLAKPASGRPIRRLFQREALLMPSVRTTVQGGNPPQTGSVAAARSERHSVLYARMIGPPRTTVFCWIPSHRPIRPLTSPRFVARPEADNPTVPADRPSGRAYALAPHRMRDFPK